MTSTPFGEILDPAPKADPEADHSNALLNVLDTGGATHNPF